MPAISSSAPGKVILFGEHAVVYGRPALAVPVRALSARAVVQAAPLGEPGSVWIQAPDIELEAWLSDLPDGHPLAAALNGVLQALKIARVPACKVRLNSTIPIASGLGSGAAASVALIRAFTTFLGRQLEPEQVSAIAYEVEKLHHGTPSGIDNTVIAYEMPVYFIKGSPNRIERLSVAEPFSLLIADTGIPSPTAVAVGNLRQAWLGDREHYEALFDQVGEIARQARQAIEAGYPQNLGPLMDANHHLLGELGVSSPELDRLVDAARRAGALGAKLSGGGRGGNLIALVRPGDVETVQAALERHGAARVIHTRVEASA